MKYILKNSDKQKIIQTIISYISYKYNDIRTVYIFGSFVSSQSFSDIDIGVITEMDLSKPLDFELKLERQLETLVKYPVDIRILNQAPISFSRNVFKSGKVIIDKKPNMRADFETRILKQYFDFSPFQKEYLKEVTNAPV